MGGCMSADDKHDARHDNRAPPKVGPGEKNGDAAHQQQQVQQQQVEEQQRLQAQREEEARKQREQQEEAERKRKEEEERKRQEQEAELQRQQQEQQKQQEAAQAAAARAAAAAAPLGVATGGLRQVNEDEEHEVGGAWEADMQGVQPPELQEYTYSDLVEATASFEENSVLGEGGFGKVYKGVVTDRFPVGGGKPKQASVAIKKLNPSGYQSKVEWMREILVLGKLQHPNLVRLIGYCAEVEEMLLVYEFVPLGSLDYHLWPAPNTDAAPLPWQARLRIAHDAAAGLAHLHANNFIHRDFKAPNILIDQDYSGKLTDFGLAKDGPDAGQTHVSTQIMGTMGYLDPRYAETGQLTVKSDVYAYGVVLLELLTGKKAMGISPGGKPKTLTSWARPLLCKGRPDLESLVDPNLIDPFPEKVARTLAISAKHCIQDDTSMRPMMSDIVDTLRPLNQAINGRR